MNTFDKTAVTTALTAWRIRVLNIFLTITVTATLPALAMIIINELTQTKLGAPTYLFIVIELFLIVIAIFRRIPIHVRVSGVLLLAYAAAILNLLLSGVRGGAPLYLILIPVLVLLFIGKRASIFFTILNALILIATALLIQTGLLIPTGPGFTAARMDVWMGLTTDLMILGILMTLLLLFYRFQERLIDRERKAQALLAEQKTNLEGIVAERTNALLRSNSIQKALYEITEAANTSQDMQAFYHRIHQIVGELMVAGNFFIALYDEDTDLLSFPYFVDEMDDSFPTVPMGNSRNLTSYIIRTGNTIKHGQEEFKRLQETKEYVMDGTPNEDGIGAPLRSDGKVIGAIYIQSYTKGIQYTAQDDEVLAFVAQHIATALTRVRAQEAERERTAELALINSVQSGLASSKDIQSIYELVGEKIREIFNANTLVIATFDLTSNQMFRHYTYEKGVRIFHDPMPIPAHWQAVIHYDQPLLINKDFLAVVKDFNPDFQVPSGEVPKSVLNVPFKIQVTKQGVISLQNVDEEYAFTLNDKHLLETLANTLSVALENAILFTETQRLLAETEKRNSELKILNNLSQAMTQTLDVKTVSRIAGDNLREIFNSDAVSIMLLDPDQNLIHSYYEYDKNEGGYVENIEPFPLGTGLTSKVIGTRQPLLLGTLQEEIANGAYFPPELVEQGSGTLTQSWLGVPIISGDQVLGIVFLGDYQPQAFNDNHLRLLQTLSSNIGIAIENARLFQAEQKRVRELATINAISSTLVGELDFDALINLVGEEIRTAFNADIAYVALLDDTRNIINFPYTYGEDLSSIIYGEGVTSEVIATNKPLLINQDLDQHIADRGEEIIGKASLSYLGVPILVRGKAVGVISVQSIHKEGIFNEDDLRLLNTIAANVSPAVQNAHLFTQLQSQKKFSDTLITTSPVAIATLDNDNRVKSWNPAAEKLFGYTQTEALGRLIVDLVSNESTRAEALNISALIGEGKAVHEFVQRNRKDGKNVELELFAVPVVFDGERVGTFTIYHDVSEIKQAQQAILESERRLEDIINFLPDATMVIDRQGRVIAWNRAIEEMTGIKAEDMIGKGDYEYALPFYGERRPILIDLVQLPREEFEARNYVQIKRVGELLIGETYTPSLKQGARYLYATATLLHDSKGNITGAAETIRDITERKVAEEELQRAKEAADAANQAKSAFLANMSHELRTPLNAIIGFTRIVRRKGEGLLPEKQTENLDKVLTSAEHLLGLINTMLDIAKIEAGRVDVLAANFRIQPLIDMCVNTAQPLLKPNVELEKIVEDNLSTLYSDQDKIRQIILNLLSNAAKFTHKGKITLSALLVDEDQVKITVADTGIGISPEALPLIFKVFQQADASITREYGGTGLGLTISRNLARLLGGDLTVESEVDQGSVFTLTLPIQYKAKTLQIDENQIPAPESLMSNLSPQPSGKNKKRVLVIDDDPDAEYLLRENIASDEFEIIGTRSAEEGLQLAREQHPQAILLDILMPHTNGWLILNHLKQNPATAHIPVILLTVIDKKALGFRLGASDYLLKPLDPTLVRDALNRVINPLLPGQKRVLLVDDDPLIADMLRQFIPESEFLLDSALDGLEALDMVAKNPPDIILLDLIMPRLDGFGVIERLRANPDTQNLPIIVISAKDLTQEEVTRLKKSVSKILKKQGFDNSLLIDELHKVLK